jgi:hypothetical protein
MFRITDVIPTVFRISNKKEDKFKLWGDLTKIKGFITELKNLHKLKELNLSIGFGDNEPYNVPFSFLLNYNNNVRKINNYENEKQDNYFIEFPHDILLGHKIPLITLKYSPFTIYIEGLNENIIIDVVMNNYLIHKDEHIKAINLYKSYDVKFVNEHKINLISYEPNFCDYENEIKINFLTQGIIIKTPKQKIISTLLTINKSLKRLDYNDNLINIYGEDIGDNLTYFGFNMDEKFTSNNKEGSISLYAAEIVNIKVRILNNTNKKPNNYKPLEIYTIEWNGLKYGFNMCAYEYMKTKYYKKLL